MSGYIFERAMSEHTDLVLATISKYSRKKAHLPIKNISMDIKTKLNIYKLIRLKDEQLPPLEKASISIAGDGMYLMDMAMEKGLIYASLSKMYITLKTIFGESSRSYDESKSSFSFPFLVCFKKGESEFEYLMKVCNYRSIVEFRIYKLVLPGTKLAKQGGQHEPFKEFPKEEINYFITYLTGFLTGFFHTTGHEYNVPFFKMVRSNLVLFGYKDGRFFDEDYEERKDFDKALAELFKRGIECEQEDED